MIFYIFKTKNKNFLFESIYTNESYFIFVIKYLNNLFPCRQISLYVKSEKEFNFSINNKDKIGAEIIIGTSYIFKKKKTPYLNINLNSYSVDVRVLSCKFKDFCFKYNITICVLNTDIIQSKSRFKKSIEEKRNRTYIYFNKKKKDSKQKNIFWINIYRGKVFMYFLIFQNFFYIKGFFKKNNIFLFKFIKNYCCVKLLNTEIAYLVKQSFKLYFTDIHSMNFLFLENTYSDFNIANYSYVQQIVIWANKYVPRISIEEEKKIDFFTNFENLILIKKHLTDFSIKIMAKIKSIFFLNSDFIISYLKTKKNKNLKYKWLLISSFANPKFGKRYYSEINISFNIVNTKNSIYNATSNKVILIQTIRGQNKNEESTDFTRTEYIEYYRKNRLSSKKNTILPIGTSNFYLNI